MSTGSVEPEILFHSRGCVREIVLNKPAKLNALNADMIAQIPQKLVDYTKSELANSILLRGATKRALSAGADVKALALKIRSKETGSELEASKFFNSEFSLNHQIATLEKPFISLMSGVVMGGGAGLTCHGAFRVATETTLLAMPETRIGYYPDVGMLFFMSRLTGQLGLYAALTGHRFAGFDAYKFGFATHYIAEDSAVDMQRRLEELEDTFGDSKEYFKLVDWCIEEFGSEPPQDYIPSLKNADLDVIDAAFQYDTVEEIVAALKTTEGEFAAQTLETLLSRCPLSLKATLQAFRNVSKLDFQAALQQDAVLSYNFVTNPNFSEGVLALLADKRDAKWDPADLASVNPQQVDALFQTPDASETGFEPVKFVNDTTFYDYPNHYGLPSVQDIQNYVTGETSEQDTKATRKDVIDFFRAKYPEGVKTWLKEYINEVLDRKTSPDPTDSTLLDWNY